MHYDGLERKILERMKTLLVARKSELMDLVKEESSNPRNVVEVIVKALIQKELIIPIYASESTFAITQKGIKEF